MGNLALMYWAQGWTGSAAALEEDVLEKCRRILTLACGIKIIVLLV